MVFLLFGSAETRLLSYLGHHWILAHMTFSLFTNVSLGDVAGTRCSFDRYSFVSYCFHCANK
jgi:hypothetical protein